MMSRRLIREVGLVGVRCPVCRVMICASIQSQDYRRAGLRGSPAILTLSCPCRAITDRSHCTDPRFGRGPRAQRSALERMGRDRVALLRRTPTGEVAPGTYTPPRPPPTRRVVATESREAPAGGTLGALDMLLMSTHLIGGPHLPPGKPQAILRRMGFVDSIDTAHPPTPPRPPGPNSEDS